MSRDRGEGILRPRPGQESVWDYPRPPVVVPDGREITRSALRVLETAGPPTFYGEQGTEGW